MDRRDFVLDSDKVSTMAYMDTPLPIGHGATISAPHMHAHVLELLSDKLIPGAKVLDVGSGSGYLCVAMSLLVGENGSVTGIEHIPELVSWSIKNVAEHHKDLLSSGRLKIMVGDGYVGLPNSKFDAIHVGAAAPHTPQVGLVK